MLEPLKKHPPVTLVLALLLLLPVLTVAKAQTTKPAPAPAPAPAAPAHTGKAPEAAPAPHEAPPKEAPSEARPAHSSEQGAEPQHSAQPEHNAQPEHSAQPEHNGNPRPEMVPWHPDPEHTPSAANRSPEATSSGSSTSLDGTRTTSITRRDGSTRTTIAHPDGTFTTNERGPHGESLGGSSGTGDGSYSGSVVSPIPAHMSASPGFRRPPEPDSAEAQATLHQLNAARAKLSGVNRFPIPGGQVFNFGNVVNVRTGDGRSYFLRADGTIARFQSRVGQPNALGRVTTASGPQGTAATSSPSERPVRPIVLSAMGDFASFRPDGKIISLRTGGPKGLDIQHGARGERIITSRRPDHSVLVSTGRHSGYLERTINQDGRTLILRTYFSGNRTYRRAYARFTGRFASMQVNGPRPKLYIPRHVYAPAFYGWVYGGWNPPVFYPWNWMNRRWYAFYRLFFAPWPVYPDGSYWLTDYVLGQTLADGYDMQQPDDGSAGADGSSDANSDSSSADPGQQTDDETVYAPAATAISPEVKQEIAAEVHRQLAADSTSDAGSEPAQAAAPDDPAQFMQVGHLFVVTTPINVRIDAVYRRTVAFGAQQCNLSPGDVLRLTRIPQLQTAAVAGADVASLGTPALVFLEVAASQRMDCPAGVQVGVQTVALQEMENSFQAQLDDGLHLMYSQQGKNGLPAAPPSTAAEQPLPADPAESTASLSTELMQLQRQANQAEAQITQTVMSAQTTTNQP